MGLFEPPTYDERPPLGSSPLDHLARDERDGPTWEEKAGAGEWAVKVRRKGSTWAAAFGSLMWAAGVDKACAELNRLTRPPKGERRTIRFDPNEFRRVLLTIMDAAERVEIDAGKSGGVVPRRRRFKAPAYKMGAYYRREEWPKRPPDGAPADEWAAYKKELGRLDRYWRRRLKPALLIQSYLHLGLFGYERGEKTSNKIVSPYLTERVCELLGDIVKRAASSGGNRIARYNSAAQKALQEFRADEAHAFAPEWAAADLGVAVKKEKSYESKAPSAEEDAEDRLVSIERKAKSIARSCAAAVREFVGEKSLTAEEAEALRVALHAEIETQLAGTTPPGGGDRGGGETTNADTQSAPRLTPHLVRTHVVELNGAANAKTPTKTEVKAVETCEIPADPAEQASKLIDAFESVGAERYKAVFLSAEPLEGKAECVGAEDLTGAAHARSRCLAYVERSERRRESVSLRVWGGGGIVQLDDVNPQEYPPLAPFCFAGVETSEGSVNLFLSLGGVSDDARSATRERLLRQINPAGRTAGTANGGAYNAVRLPGTLNTKEKHRQKFGAYPRVRLLFVRPGLTISPLELERAGLLAPVIIPAPRPEVPRDVAGRLPSGWPDLNRYKSLKWKTDGNRPDRSSAEAAWVGAAWRMGWPEHMIVRELERITEKGRGRRDDYCAKTVRNVVDYVRTQPDTRASAGRERMVV